jgi:hypothetical protein
MGSITPNLATALRDELGLRRAIETGTYFGVTARILAGIFDEVITIELSPDLAANAASRLADRPNVRVISGDSRAELRELATGDLATLYFLDGHWSGGPTAGESAECPVLEEIDALAAGHSRDCVFIDDARLFAAAPPPPHKAEQWPTLMEVLDALRRARPGHHITVLEDQVIATPPELKPLIDAFGRGDLAAVDQDEAARPAPGVLARLRQAVRPRG